MTASSPTDLPECRATADTDQATQISMSICRILFCFAFMPMNRKTYVGLSYFDVLNHPNDLSYTGVITSSFFGHAVAAYPPRRMQISAEFTF